MMKKLALFLLDGLDGHVGGHYLAAMAMNAYFARNSDGVRPV